MSETIGFDSLPETEYPLVALNADLALRLSEIFLLALADYKSHRRGDVGSWCRMAGMNGLTSLILKAGNEASFDGANCLSTSTGTSIATITVGAILIQLAEKLDTVRQRAGYCLERLLMEKPEIGGITDKAELMQFLGICEAQRLERNWDDPSFTFPRVMDVASLREPVYYENVIVGIVTSIGGLTETVSKQAATNIRARLKLDVLHLLLFILAIVHSLLDCITERTGTAC